MKAILAFIATTIVSFAGVALSVGKEDNVSDMKIAKFHGDRPAAISFTVDDGFRGSTEEFVKAFGKVKFAATFFVVPAETKDADGDGGNRTSWKRWKEVIALGFEVGNHGMTHADLRKTEESKQEEEIDKAAEIIKQKLDLAWLSYCYAFGAKTDASEKRVLAGHVGAAEKRPFYGGDKWTLEQANKWVDEAIKKGQWMVPMLHSLSKGYAAFKNIADFDEHLKYVKKHESQIWIDTFGNVARYVKERDSAKLEGKVSADKAEFKLTCPLDSKIYDQPLTVVIPAKGATKATAKRGGEELPAVVKGDCILIDVPPADDPVTVSWETGK